MNELEFHCIYWQSKSSGVSSKYSTKQSNKMQNMKGKCLSTKQRHKPNSLKPSKLLPHWHQLPKWVKKLRRPIWWEFLHKLCISHNVSEIKCTYRMTNIRRESNYNEDQRLQKDSKVKKIQQMKQAIKWTKKKIPKER